MRVKEFRFGDLISDIYKAKAINKDDLTVSNGDTNAIRYITRTGENNGCELLADRREVSIDYIESGNAITIGDTTATCFYQDEDFINGDHMVVVRADSWLNRDRALYVIALLNNEQYKYSYGRAFLMERIKDTVLKLPVKGDGNPDWQFMEDYIKSLHHKPLTTKNKPGQVPDLKLNEWKEFRVGDLFDITRGHTLSVEDKENFVGDIPCVNGTSENNGVQCKLSDDIQTIGFDRIKSPALSIVRVGEGGRTFVQSEDFFIADNAFALTRKTNMNVYHLVFISSLLNKECVKYSYGRTVTSDYVDTIIKLPTNADGNPDWQFMEDYIKSLPYGDRLEG